MFHVGQDNSASSVNRVRPGMPGRRAGADPGERGACSRRLPRQVLRVIRIRDNGDQRLNGGFWLLVATGARVRLLVASMVQKVTRQVLQRRRRRTWAAKVRVLVTRVGCSQDGQSVTAPGAFHMERFPPVF
jgi:hypothetical protein